MARPRAGMSKQAKCTLLLQTCVRFHLLYFLFVGTVRICFHNARNNTKKSLLNNVSEMMEDREIAKNVQEDVKSWNSINKFSDTHKKRKQTPYLIQWTTTEWELILRELKLNIIFWIVKLGAKNSRCSMRAKETWIRVDRIRWVPSCVSKRKRALPMGNEC